MQATGTTFITISRAADMLGSKPADVLALANSGELDSHEDDGRLLVSRVSVMGHIARSNR